MVIFYLTVLSILKTDCASFQLPLSLFGQKPKKMHFIQTEKLHFAQLYFCLPEVIDSYQNMTKVESYFTFSLQLCDHPFKSIF